MIRILGAGLSGLSAAINLAKEGAEVEVYEGNSSVGQQIYPNFQALIRTKGDLKGYLASLNLHPEFNVQNFKKAFLSTPKRNLDVKMAEEVSFIQRGGEGSLECGLFEEAKSLGVGFKFKSRLKNTEADIIASGHYRCDMAAFGAVFEDTSFPEDRFFYLYDDRYSPRGWYLYIVPLPDGDLEVVNCVSQPYVPLVRSLFYKALDEVKILKELIGGGKSKTTFGGFGGVYFPKSAVRDGRIYVGEAAGFQDPFRGFGMNYALESGFLAAKAILENQDYDKLWQEKFKRQRKMDFARRFTMVAAGDKLPEKYLKRFEDGDTVDLNKSTPTGFFGNLAIDLCYQLEHLYYGITGHW
ncbi:NAD(P)/FAD-dependent oxidoreductase [Candidatus Altiarchaeota archaeon]